MVSTILQKYEKEEVKFPHDPGPNLGVGSEKQTLKGSRHIRLIPFILNEISPHKSVAQVPWAWIFLHHY